MNGIRWLLVAVALAACATTTPPELLRGWVPERKAVVVAMSLPPADAYRRVVAAFTAERLAIEAADEAGGWLRSAPQTMAPVGAWLQSRPHTAYWRYRATVMGAGPGSEVTLSLTYALQQGTQTPSDDEFWRRMQRIADRLRAP